MKTLFPMVLGPLGLALALMAPHLAAQPAGYFAMPKPVPGLPTAGQYQFTQTMTADGLTFIYNSDGTLYQARRSSRDQPFVNIQPLGATINTSAFEETGPTLTADGLGLVFQRDPPGQTDNSSPEMNLFEARRANVDEPFGAATPLPDTINRYSAFTPHLSPDGLLLLFGSIRPGGRGGPDIWVAARSSLEAPFDAPMNLNDFFPGSQVNSPYEENGPSLSSDGLTLCFADLYESRPKSGGGPDIWVATRPNRQAPFGLPVNLNQLGLGSALNQSSWDGFVFLARDWPGPGSKLYFSSNRRTGSFDFDYWECEWVPFRITGLTPTPVGLQVDFTAKANRSFDVQYHDDLNSTGWISLQGPILATNNAMSVIDPTPPNRTQRFYRVLAP